MSDVFWLHVAFGAFAGFVCGLAPLVYGINKKQDTLGTVSLFLCAIAGAMFGLLAAVPVSVVMVMVIAGSEKRRD